MRNTQAEGRELELLHERLGWKKLSPLWAKLEILLGLAAAGVGLFFGVSEMTLAAPQPAYVSAALILFVLGGYLTSAGHRSHLYQSNTQLTAYLVAITRQETKDTHV